MGDKDELISRLLYEMVGNEGIRVINSLSRPCTDLKIHDKTQIPITRVRTTLNILHKHNIVSYCSSRDEDRGWFKYTWELKKGSIESSLKNFLISRMMKLKRDFQEISQVDFFKCENGCTRLTFTESYEENFRCPICNAVLKPADSILESRQIKKEIQQIRKMLGLLGPLPNSLRQTNPPQ
jgi:transcription initiation factor TFIIE subunit alpha